jgi:hypothetical protein
MSQVSGKEKTKKDKEVSLPFAEEILVTKADLEEKLNAIAELKNKVEELQLHNEYQSRLREMNYQEKLRDVTEVCLVFWVFIFFKQIIIILDSFICILVFLVFFCHMFEFITLFLF